MIKPRPRSEHAEVVVVGAGPGGLATAMLLAAQGRRVTVLEAAAGIGGRTGQIELGAYRFDRGPTFFLMPYVLEEIFAIAGARTGRSLQDYVHLTRLDPMYRLIMGRQADGDGRPGSLTDPVTLDATQDLQEMSRRLGAIDAADGRAFERFIADNRQKLRLMEPILRSPMRGLVDVINVGSVRFLPHLHPHRSVADLLRSYFRSPYTRLGVSFQSKYLGMSPMDCPSLFTILPFIEYEYGVWHPTGGCHALIQGMAKACRDLGVDIVTSAPVRAVEFERRRVCGVRYGEDQVLACDHVVLNADAAHALRTLVPHEIRAGTGWDDQSIDRKRYSCSTFMMYLGIRGRVEHLPHHTIFISSRYRENLADITDHGRLSEDPSVYVCNPCQTDPTLAPAERSSLYVLMPTPNTRGGPEWSEEQVRDARGRVMRQLRERFDIENLESRIEQELILTPRDWQASGVQFGATFNLSHNLGQMLHRRVPHRFPGANGLWFVGGGTHPGSGLPVIFLSAQVLAKLMNEQAPPRARELEKSPVSSTFTAAASAS